MEDKSGIAGIIKDAAQVGGQVVQLPSGEAASYGGGFQLQQCVGRTVHRDLGAGRRQVEADILADCAVGFQMEGHGFVILKTLGRCG